MFTGIVEAIGIISQVVEDDGNRLIWIESPISREFKVDQSVNHNGVCLTIEEIRENNHRVTAIKETLNKTNLGHWTVGDLINLERSLKPDSRLDGHFVQGHVDTTATCTSKKENQGSWEYQFEFPRKFAELVIEKGSISVDGISLTVFDVTKKKFTVAVIPYTLQNTNLAQVKKGDSVNIEFDLVGKYIMRRLQLK